MHSYPAMFRSTVYIIIGKDNVHYGLNILSEAFHLELTTVFLQQPPLSRVFLWNRLLSLLDRGNLAVVGIMVESERVSGQISSRKWSRSRSSNATCEGKIRSGALSTARVAVV